LLTVAAVSYTGIEMKPPPFQYHDPRTIAEAVGLLGTLENAKLLAGGQSLMPMLNMRFVLPDHVIDLNRVEGLSYIKETGGVLEIGAMTRQYEVEFSEIVRTRCPLLHQAILQVGHRQTRNRGTVGGSLCHLDPAAELVSVAAALDATIVVTNASGRREIKFADFPVAYMTPAIEQNEILTAVRFPLWKAGHGAAFVEFARRHGDFAIVSAAALLERDGGGIIARASITIGGIGSAPVRVKELEEAIVGKTASAELFRTACESCRKLDAIEDIHAPASYRQHLAVVLSRRALEQASGIAPQSATSVH
jgi:carbon-monoxide dehydrogenase medium subunit